MPHQVYHSPQSWISLLSCGARCMMWCLPLGFANDLIVVIVVKPEDVGLYANKTRSAIKAWLEVIQFDLAEQKVEAVLITFHRKRNTISFHVDGNSNIKYLGVMIDEKIMRK